MKKEKEKKKSTTKAKVKNSVTEVDATSSNTTFPYLQGRSQDIFIYRAGQVETSNPSCVEGHSIPHRKMPLLWGPGHPQLKSVFYTMVYEYSNHSVQHNYGISLS